MALGLPSQVIKPTAASSPSVGTARGELGRHHLVVSPGAGGCLWGVDQAGWGIWLLAAPRGLSCGGWPGLVSVGWGLVVWVFGESFGGIFAPGLSWMTGAPGAVLIYVAAGVLIALPEQAWRSPRARPDGHGWTGDVPGRHGGPAGLAGPRVLAGRIRQSSGLTGRNGCVHVGNPAASHPVPVGVCLRHVRRGARGRSQPHRRRRADGNRRGLPELPSADNPRRSSRVHRRVPGRLAAGSGSRLSRRHRHRPEQHDPADLAGDRRLSGIQPGRCPAARAGRGRGGLRADRGPGSRRCDRGSARHCCARGSARRAHGRWRLSARLA